MILSSFFGVGSGVGFASYVTTTVVLELDGVTVDPSTTDLFGVYPVIEGEVTSTNWPLAGVNDVVLTVSPLITLESTI